LFHASLLNAALSEINSGCLAGADFLFVLRNTHCERVDVPQNYDWRYRVISNLLSPRDNPSHYWMAACGLALTGLLMLPFAGYLRRHLGVIAPRTANISAGTYGGNYRADLHLLRRSAAHS